MNLKWMGTRTESNTYPEIELPINANALTANRNEAYLMLIPAIIIPAIFFVFKMKTTGFYLMIWTVPISIIIALFLIPIHELLHAIAYPKNVECLMFYEPKAFGIGLCSTYPIKKSRFILVTLLPSLILSIIPLIIFLYIPLSMNILSNIILITVAGSMGSLIGNWNQVIKVILHVPQNGIIVFSKDRFYWYNS